MSWWSDFVDYGNSVDPNGNAGYVVDPVSALNMGYEDYSGSTVDEFTNGAKQIGEKILEGAQGVGDFIRDGINDLLGKDENPGGGGPPGGGGLFNKKQQEVKDLIDATTRYNNEWSAQQAEIQRDWQKMMSDTAHQRETADLKAAGLNPVLSAGGTGASTPSGAMGQTDTSNTRLIAELAMSAINGLSGAAVGGAAGQKGFMGWLSNNRKNINTIISGVRTGLGIAKLIASL